MIAALEGGECSATHTGRSLPPGKIQYPLYRMLGGPQSRSGPAENLVPTGIRSRTMQPVAQSPYRLSFPTHIIICIYTSIYIYIYVCVCVLVQIISNEQKKCTDAHKNKSSGHLETRYLMFRRSVISLSGGGPWFSPTAVHVRFKEIKGTW